jgi:hypothetical protein
MVTQLQVRSSRVRQVEGILFYRRFLRTDGTEQHYVLMGRLATILLFFCSSACVFFLETAQDSFNIILQIGAGTGLLYLLRWF